MTQNGSTPWGAIKEIPASEMDAMHKGRYVWLALWQEILLRLEKTPASKALEIPFNDDKTAQRASQAFYNAAKSHQLDVIIRTRKDGNGGRIIYVRRGPTWGKSS